MLRHMPARLGPGNEAGPGAAVECKTPVGGRWATGTGHHPTVPFVFWVGFAILLTLVLWRTWRKYPHDPIEREAVLREFEERTGRCAGCDGRGVILHGGVGTGAPLGYRVNRCQWCKGTGVPGGRVKRMARSRRTQRSSVD
jgi:hypothetical protein